ANKVTRILNLQLKPLGNKGNNNGTATSLAWDKTGRYLATGTTNEVVYIWDTHTGELCHTLTGHIGWVVSVAFDMT
ncbi:MAG TPA: hypothetical protein PLZ51_29515, partial [Aggregatilineales bacterium]|nr:hypothetical protein [Aggregatilineales bacterium]